METKSEALIKATQEDIANRLQVFARKLMEATVYDAINKMTDTGGPGGTVKAKGKKAKTKTKKPLGYYKVGQKGQLPKWLKSKGIKDSAAAKKKWPMGTKVTPGTKMEAAPAEKK
jgi:hypothetical protein